MNIMVSSLFQERVYILCSGLFLFCENFYFHSSTFAMYVVCSDDMLSFYTHFYSLIFQR